MSALRDVLVIDDEPSVTQAVVKVCSAEGMTVSATGNASEALRFLEQSNFRLVLCDIMMSGLDGFQFLEELALPPVKQIGVDPQSFAHRRSTFPLHDHVTNRFLLEFPAMSSALHFSILLPRESHVHFFQYRSGQEAKEKREREQE